MPELFEKLKNLQSEGGNSVFTEAEQNEIVKRYMNVLFLLRKKDVAPSTPEKAQALLDEVIEKLKDENTGTIDRIRFAQKKVELQRFIDGQKGVGQAKLIEEAFIKIVREFSKRKGIEYAAWRELGVPTMVLKRGSMQPRSIPTAKLSDTVEVPIPDAAEYRKVFRQMDLQHRRKASKTAQENTEDAAEVIDLASENTSNTKH